MTLSQAHRAARLDGSTLRDVVEKIAAAPANEDVSLRRLIWHARDFHRAFDTIQPWPASKGEEESRSPAPPPRFYDFQVTLNSDKLAALDRGEVIHLIVANRHCLVRLRDLP
jgi:hypothetical protein